MPSSTAPERPLRSGLVCSAYDSWVCVVEIYYVLALEGQLLQCLCRNCVVFFSISISLQTLKAYSRDAVVIKATAML